MIEEKNKKAYVQPELEVIGKMNSITKVVKGGSQTDSQNGADDAEA